MSEAEKLSKLRELTSSFVAANFAHGIGTICDYVAAKDALVNFYLENFDTRTVKDGRLVERTTQ